ncbi:hypothetical protein MalM25_10140 [Planctomycetes bacterium MalM25]|nr:hypothetical protein MalM25_10140 [Planctomycetes bacterium MalM25]
MIRLAFILAAATTAGCALSRPEPVDPSNLPSPSYLTDDVQYYAPGPEFKEAKKAAELKAQAEDQSN